MGSCITVDELISDKEYGNGAGYIHLSVLRIICI